MEKVWTKSESSVPFSQTFMSLQRSYNLYESAVKQLALKFEIFNSEFNVFYDHNPIHPQLQRLPVAALGHPGAGLPRKYTSAIKNAEIDRQMQDRYKRIKASEGEKK